jgi:molybdate transport system ATP-binding protein
LSLDAELRVPDRLDVTLSAEPGKVVAVIGPNGAGKSTLVKALAGLVPVNGHARLGGIDLLRLNARDRRVGMVFQDRLLFPHLSARANVAFGPRARGVRRTEAEAQADVWLGRLGIADLAGRKPGQLSGGQAQRVSIARALATEPSLLLLDEPMAGLDVGVATALRIELAAHLAAYDGITLLVTHDAIDALTIADRVLVIDQGRVAQHGTPAEVAQRPATEHVARLVGLNVIREGTELRSFSPTAVTVDLTEPHGSARNRWRGKVVSATPHGVAVRLVVRAEGTVPVDLIADVTPAAATELGLVPGRAVWLSVKETSVNAYRIPGP